MTQYPGWRGFDPRRHNAQQAIDAAKPKPAPRPSTARVSGIAFDRLCYLQHLPMPLAEHRFHVTRKWRFDWAWPDVKVALEVHGGTFIAGKHSRGVGQRIDFEKWSNAAALGWRIVHVLPEQLESLQTLEWLRLCLRP